MDCGHSYYVSSDMPCQESRTAPQLEHCVSIALTVRSHYPRRDMFRLSLQFHVLSDGEKKGAYPLTQVEYLPSVNMPNPEAYLVNES